MKIKTSASSKVLKIVGMVVLLVMVILAIVPFVYMLLVSLMEDSSTMKLSSSELAKATWSINNYKKVFLTSNFGRYLLNSIIVSVIACAVSCLTATMSAYAFAKKKFPAKDRLYFLYLMTMMVPGEVTIIPLYIIIRKLGLINNLAGIAIPTCCGAFGTMLMYSFMKIVPDELLEAADIDGCNEITKFFSIIVPLVKSAIISLAIFIFITSWGSLLWPLIVTTKAELSTVTTAVAKMNAAGGGGVNYGYLMAGTTLAFLPPFILYVALQKQFVEGIALSGTKT